MKKLLTSRREWLAWRDANMLDPLEHPQPRHFPCVAVLIANQVEFVFQQDFKDRAALIL